MNKDKVLPKSQIFDLLENASTCRFFAITDEDYSFSDEIEPGFSVKEVFLLDGVFVSESRYCGATGSSVRRNDYGGSFLEPDLVFETGNGNCVSFLS